MSTHRQAIINPTQAIIIIINYILGVGILTLPRTAAAEVGTPDIWITILISSIFPIAAGLIILKLNNRYPNKTYYQYCKNIVGKFLGIILGLFMIGYFITLSSFEVRVMAEVTETYLLEGTPVQILIILFLWLTLYLNIDGINSIARMFQIIFPLTVFIFIFLALLSLGLFELNNLRPVLGNGIVPVLKGIKTTSLSYIGIEIMIILSVFLTDKNKGKKIVLIGVLMPMIFYLITVVIVIGALSVEGVSNLTWPTITLIRSFEFPGIFFERYDSLFLIVWILQIFATTSITLFAASLGLSQIFNKNIKYFMYALLPIVFIISMLPKDLHQIFSLGDMLGNAAILLFGILPILLLSISYLRRINR
ncbi:GerAB/ArcD/ProY family transporter [Sutcliffiella halmapala]|uniref:GerAB/ArcD/ProY family transporter n=1 Tax=Sutcliffiella halmapala TaxID=79882 RepID=UPI000994DD8D|nr:GerAB/ArcD/ProY family transporter [Sutcliffiella halmapala]